MGKCSMSGGVDVCEEVVFRYHYSNNNFGGRHWDLLWYEGAVLRKEKSKAIVLPVRR
jgi:hypothetical protein